MLSGPDWALAVDVKVDFLRPTIETVQQSFQSAWAQLPPPVQQVGFGRRQALTVWQ